MSLRGFCLCLVGRRMLSSREAMHSMITSNHWAWSYGVRLLVRFLGHKTNEEQGSC